MSCSEIRLEPGGFQEFEESCTESAKGRLRVLSELQGGLLCLFGVIIKRRRREDDLREWRLSGILKPRVDLAIRLQQRREVQEEFAPHVEVLRTLSGEECDHLALGVHALLAESNALE